ncbi:HNH endonuclease [Uliginosibacterium sp. 31-12]|uniref:HNH endonuclease n=1 Tax=Uliginosibacterium sp. 31-12 TaxID=3062781 RepID=UPI0026E36339|nr:HNH endonuclease [Uliginosibacterium sp. 31-12]MDO6385603.1 HNH endonuclease [Uliginosibacterium sp. 31-12]
MKTAMRRRVFHEENFTCAKCGVVGFEKKFPKGGYGYYTNDPAVFLSIDHIKPKSLGGGHERENLRVLCTTCNTQKGVKNA